MCCLRFRIGRLVQPRNHRRTTIDLVFRHNIWIWRGSSAGSLRLVGKSGVVHSVKFILVTQPTFLCHNRSFNLFPFQTRDCCSIISCMSLLLLINYLIRSVFCSIKYRHIRDCGCQDGEPSLHSILASLQSHFEFFILFFLIFIFHVCSSCMSCCNNIHVMLTTYFLLSTT